MSSQIATCLTDQNNYSTAVDQILHALCFELEHLGPLPRAAAPAEKDTRTIWMLKECLAMRGWNMYISLYIFTGRNLITHLTLFFFQIKFQIHLYNVYKVRAQDRQVCIWGQAPRCPGKCLHVACTYLISEMERETQNGDCGSEYYGSWSWEPRTQWLFSSGCSSSTSIVFFFFSRDKFRKK